jgi:hypothetical protein
MEKDLNALFLDTLKDIASLRDSVASSTQIRFSIHTTQRAQSPCRDVRCWPPLPVSILTGASCHHSHARTSKKLADAALGVPVVMNFVDDARQYRAWRY